MKRFEAIIGAIWRFLDLDRVDLLAALALIMLFRGLAMLSEAAAWTVCGIVVLVLSLIGAFRARAGS